MRGIRLRLQMNRMLFLYRDKTWFDAVAKVHKFVDAQIDKTFSELDERELARKNRKKPSSPERTDLLWVMAQQLRDKKALRSQILAVFVPSNDTTSILISNAFYALARHPKVWAKLREEVASVDPENLTWDTLRGMRYLNWILNESKSHPRPSLPLINTPFPQPTVSTPMASRWFVSHSATPPSPSAAAPPANSPSTSAKAT